MKIYIGADHRGFQLKHELVSRLRYDGHEVVDEGDKSLQPDDDYPKYAAKVATAVLGHNDSRGILICSSGQGVCMAANRFKGIRAAMGYDREAARSSRHDDDSNVLCLSADELKSEQAFEIVDLWLSTPFAAAPRYIRRIQELDNF